MLLLFIMVVSRTEGNSEEETILVPGAIIHQDGKTIFTKTLLQIDVDLTCPPDIFIKVTELNEQLTDFKSKIIPHWHRRYQDRLAINATQHLLRGFPNLKIVSTTIDENLTQIKHLLKDPWITSHNRTEIGKKIGRAHV